MKLTLPVMVPWRGIGAEIAAQRLKPPAAGVERTQALLRSAHRFVRCLEAFDLPALFGLALVDGADHTIHLVAEHVFAMRDHKHCVLVF